MPFINNFGLVTIFDQRNRTRFGGSGRLAGDAPLIDGEPDGRAKVLNAPSRVNIVILENFTFEVVARTISRDDGTWEVPFLSTELIFCVIGVDPSGQVNSAIQDWVLPAEMG